MGLLRGRQHIWVNAIYYHQLAMNSNYANNNYNNQENTKTYQLNAKKFHPLAVKAGEREGEITGLPVAREEKKEYITKEEAKSQRKFSKKKLKKS